jgi:hypothetical protein
VESLWSIDQYFEFVLVLLFSTGLSFQVPVIQLLLGQSGIVSSQQMLSVWKYVAGPERGGGGCVYSATGGRVVFVHCAREKGAGCLCSVWRGWIVFASSCRFLLLMPICQLLFLTKQRRPAVVVLQPEYLQRISLNLNSSMLKSLT